LEDVCREAHLPLAACLGEEVPPAGKTVVERRDARVAFLLLEQPRPEEHLHARAEIHSRNQVSLRLVQALNPFHNQSLIKRCRAAPDIALHKQIIDCLQTVQQFQV
jgi:hypothetical protein